MRSHTALQQCLVTLATVSACAAVTPAAHAVPTTLAGVEASGSIGYIFRICSTCDTPSEQLFNQTQGGVGSTGPAIVDGFAARGDGFGSVDARALISGPAFTPQLSAYASARPGVGTHPDFSEVGAYLFSAVAQAQTAQHYTYLGTASATYDMTFTLTGSALNMGTANDNLISVLGSLVLYDADAVGGGDGGEGNSYGTWVDSDWVDFSASTLGAGNFLASRTVSITLDPGDTFYAVASLAAYVGPDAEGTADASHTLNVAFTQGDVRLLEAALQPTTQSVPEPGTSALTLLGLAALGMQARRRRGA